ncbi:MAG: gliding motility-associated C-terminal domain-containing protein [Ferruginibacter sp.]
MTKTKHLFILLPFLLMLLCLDKAATAQAPCIQWQKSYGGTLGDGEINGEYQDNSAYSVNIHPTKDGGYIISAFTQSNDGDVTGQHGGAGWGGGDFWVIKIDVAGNIQWQKALGGSSLDWAFEIKQCSDNGYVVVGWTNSPTSGDVINNIQDDTGSSGWIVKLDENGNIQWQRVAGGKDYDNFRDVVETADGGFIAVGAATSGDGDLQGLHFPVNEYDDCGWIIKFDAAGNIVWQKILDGPFSENFCSIIPTSDGNYMVCGSSNSSGGNMPVNHGGFDMWLVKINTDGDVLWQTFQGGSGHENFMDIKELPDHSFITTGTTILNSVYTMWVSKLDAAGTVLWQKNISNPKYLEFPQGIELDTDGGYIVPSYIGSFDLDYDPDWTISNGIHKLDADGNEVWFKRLGGTQHDYAASVVPAQDGGYIMASLTFSNDGDVAFNHGGADIWVVKLNNEDPPDTAIIQPVCGATTGSITVTAPLTGYEFGIDGNYQAAGQFNDLLPGTYNITVKNILSGCISPAVTAIINNPVQNNISVAAAVTTQPSCTVTTGTITVSSPTGSNYEYNAGNGYQSAALITGLAPGNYNITVRDISTGCISAPLNLVVNAYSNTSPKPSAIATAQPDCINITGAIEVTTPTGNDYQYSAGNGFQTGNIFPGLEPGNYNIIVREISSGCLSEPSPVTINNIPASPGPVQASVFAQPSCQLTTGTINVSSPAGNNFQYSIGGSYQTAAVFSQLQPGDYTITVKDVTTKCISKPVTLTVTNIPEAPETPEATVTDQPGCQLSTGTVIISSPLGNNFQYSTGGAYQAGPVFSSLQPGDYNITVKDIATGCISQPASVTINIFTDVVTKPVVNSGSICGNGTIHLTATGTGNIEWYSDESLTQLVTSGNNFNPVLSDSKYYYVVAVKGLCKSDTAVAAAIVFPIPARPSIGNDTSICPGDKLILNGGTYAAYKWQDGSSNQTLEVTNPGNYNLTVFNSDGCSNSAGINITVISGCDDIYFPNAFTPANGGPNNYFYPLGNLQLIKKYSLEIYNRYGQLVFSTNDPYQKWDGTFKGKMTANNNFVWYAQYLFKNFNRKKKGNLLLIR